MNKLFFLILVLLLSGCSLVSNNKITTFCDGLMPIDQCAEELEEPYSSLMREWKLERNVFLYNEDKQLIFFTYKNCCSSLKISSVKQEDSNTVVSLIEEGEPCECGDALQKIEINTSEPIKKNNLEIYQKYNSGVEEKIYPPKNQ